jgi:tRNA wybutosine-synthesizing protein 3
MPKDPFLQRKHDILSKIDKSLIGEWDGRIVSLCKKINSFSEFYTTSSCSGRIVVMLDKSKKQRGLFLSVYHGELTLDKLLEDLNRIKEKGMIKFKQEPPILHVHCNTLEDAKRLLRKAQLAGWKKSGIISSGKRFILEMNATEKLEFLIMDKGKILVDENFLKLIVKKSNENLKKGWLKIEKLQKSL